MEGDRKTYNKKITSQEEYFSIIKEFLGLKRLPAGYKIPKPEIFLLEIERVEGSDGAGAKITYTDADFHESPKEKTRVWLFAYQWSQSAAGRAAKKNRRLKQKARKIIFSSGRTSAQK